MQVARARNERSRGVRMEFADRLEADDGTERASIEVSWMGTDVDGDEGQAASRVIGVRRSPAY